MVAPNPSFLDTLPTEIIEQILQYAWKNTTSPSDRKQFYDTLCATDPRLHELIIHVATRYAYFDVYKFRSDDLELYRIIRGRNDSFVTNSNLDQPASLPGKLHLRIEGFAGIKYTPPPEMLPLQSIAPPFYLISDIAACVRDCTSLTVTNDFRYDSTVMQNTIAVLCHYFRSFPSLQSVHFDCYFAQYGEVPSSWRLETFPGVTFLRLKRYPPCQCDRTNIDSDPHKSDCLYTSLLKVFPRLRSLQLESPVFLKGLDPPPTLETLTIDAPPKAYIEGRKPYSSVLEYNIAAAVRRGFLRSRKGYGIQPKIFVHTGKEDPYGWEGARTACEEHHIALVKVITYENPQRIELQDGLISPS